MTSLHPEPQTTASPRPGEAGLTQQALYDEAASTFGPSLIRLARAYERDVDVREDLLQDIHFALAPFIALEAVGIAVGLTFAFASAVRRVRRCQRELDGLDRMDSE